MRQLTVAQVFARVRHLLASTPHRVLVGITGAPGAGKTEFAARLAAELHACVVAMDGFHLAHSVLAAKGLSERKGAPETFDAAGYVNLLQRIRRGGPETIWAPQFHREMEDSIAAQVAVPVDARLVVTEGNYLLLDEVPWSQIPSLCNDVYFLDPGEPVRLNRLIARHRHYGRSAAEASVRAQHGTDADNATLVRRTAHRADALVTDY